VQLLIYEYISRSPVEFFPHIVAIRKLDIFEDLIALEDLTAVATKISVF
jgi:hypothetical protein